MAPLRLDRRRLAALLSLGWMGHGRAAVPHMVELHTFGDSILDCARYNEHGVHPGQLLVRNDDRLFPDFRGQDLQSLGPARLVHHAVDGAVVDSLPAQARGLRVAPGAIALLTVGAMTCWADWRRTTAAGSRCSRRSWSSFCSSCGSGPR